MKKEIVGRGTCPDCQKVVNVVYGPCDCDESCTLQTWVCEKCGCGMTPDKELT
jgi:hypothetical protein